MLKLYKLDLELKRRKDIVNLNNSDQKESHWVAKIKHENLKIYFDSYEIEVTIKWNIDQIENVGRSSIIKGCVGYSLDENGPTINSGFQSIFTGGIKINFKRAKDDDALYRWISSTSVAPDVGKVIIENFEIAIPSVEYQEMYKIQLITELTKLSQGNNY
ncbi:Hypothetical protein CINCED_3A022460, partial [Cinara cedri]